MIELDEHFACCQTLYCATIHIRDVADRIDRELLSALMHAVQFIPLYLEAPTEELRQQVHFAIDKFDAQHAGLEHSLSLRKVYDRGIAAYREER